MKRAILWGGLIGGAADFLFASIAYGGMRGRPIGGVWQSVASGLLGKAAYDGGAATVALGVLCHFTIATIWAAIFVLASRKLPVLVRHALPAGILYGIVIYLGMNFVVIPLSAFPHKLSYPLESVAPALLVHMLLIGPPMAFAARRFAHEPARP
jgi:hypothetical protein